MTVCVRDAKGIEKSSKVQVKVSVGRIQYRKRAICQQDGLRQRSMVQPFMYSTGMYVCARLASATQSVAMPNQGSLPQRVGCLFPLPATATPSISTRQTCTKTNRISRGARGMNEDGMLATGYAVRASRGPKSTCQTPLLLHCCTTSQRLVMKRAGVCIRQPPQSCLMLRKGRAHVAHGCRCRMGSDPSVWDDKCICMYRYVTPRQGRYLPWSHRVPLRG